MRLTRGQNNGASRKRDRLRRGFRKLSSATGAYNGSRAGGTVAAHLQVLSTSSNGIMIEYIAMAGFKNVPFWHDVHDAMHFRIVETPPNCRDGYLELSDRPGLGLGQFVPEAIGQLEALKPVQFP